MAKLQLPVFIERAEASCSGGVCEQTAVKQCANRPMVLSGTVCFLAPFYDCFLFCFCFYIRFSLLVYFVMLFLALPLLSAFACARMPNGVKFFSRFFESAMICWEFILCIFAFLPGYLFLGFLQFLNGLLRNLFFDSVLSSLFLSRAWLFAFLILYNILRTPDFS